MTKKSSSAPTGSSDVRRDFGSNSREYVLSFVAIQEGKQLLDPLHEQF